jgi:ribonuclease P protein component
VSVITVPDESFSKQIRLLKRVDFRRTERRGHRRSGNHIVVIARKNEFDFSRLGITVTRKVGNAVVRNRWKRRMREIFRRNKGQVPEAWDFVVIVRRNEGYHPPFDELEREFLGLARSVTLPRDAR